MWRPAISRLLDADRKAKGLENGDEGERFLTDVFIDAELVAFFYRVPVRHMPGEWLSNVAKVDGS
jgi:hypothetical protein